MNYLKTNAIKNMKVNKRAGLQSAKVTTNFNNKNSLSLVAASPKIKNDHSSNNILPPIVTSTKNGRLAQGQIRNKSRDKNHFNESISTNATGLNSNNITEKIMNAGKQISRMNSGEISSLASGHGSKQPVLNTINKIVPKNETEVYRKKMDRNENIDDSKRARSISPFSKRQKEKAAIKEKPTFGEKKGSKGSQKNNRFALSGNYGNSVNQRFMKSKRPTKIPKISMRNNRSKD